MIIYCAGLHSSYEVEHLARLFCPEARISQKLSSRPCVYARVNKRRLVCAVSLEGKNHFSTMPLSNVGKDEKTEFALCTMLYKLLCSVFNKQLPWGLLTGVRPVRLVHDMQAKGKTEAEVQQHFKNTFYASDSKTKLVMDIARLQRPVMQKSGLRSFSLYISIPFCPTRCSYCSFVSRTTAQSKKMIQPYVQLLQKEIEYIAKMAQQLNLKLETVYIGGGTPTSLDANQLEALMKTVSQCFDLSKISEYTVEAGRPDCTDFEKLHIIKQYGATRISINPQTMQDSVLKAIGRAHTAQDIENCFLQARKAGHNNINMDLIAGLPADTLEGFKSSLNKIISMSPENITVHTLTLKRASNIVIENKQSDYADVGKMLNCCDALAQNGYLAYYLYRQKNTLDNLENTGYCKKGYEGLYNIYIMEEVHTILSAGAGGSTKLVSPSGKISRVFNYKYPLEYINGFETVLDKKKGVIDFYAGNVDT